MNQQVNTELPLFCPRKDCKFFEDSSNQITKDGVYTTKTDPDSRQMLYCQGGHHRFSETAYRELFGKHGSFRE